MKSFLFICLGFLFSNPLAAQTVSGLIRDSETKLPLANAAILQTGSSNGTVSDQYGKFSIALLPGGEKSLSISFLGYQTQTLDVSVSKRNFSVELVPDDVTSSEVLVESYRVGASAAVAHTNLDAESLNDVNFGQDIPILLGQTPSLVTTSDAGGGVGYTGLRIRGVDPGRINVTLNGIPWNDAESHNVYWVDLPDLISSADNIQIQRGVGTSTNGPAAFGATIDLQTTRFVPDPYTDLSFSYGSFNTRRMNVKFGTGLLPSGWSLNSSFSGIFSDGYIDRATSDLKSAYLSLNHPTENSLFTFNMILGREETYQAWNGVPESVAKGNRQGILDYISRNEITISDSLNLLTSGRTYNFYTYNNQVDHYGQDHYQVLYDWSPAENVELHFAAFYVKGKGYYEQFKPDDKLASYNIPDIIIDSQTTIKRSDIIRRKWLDNDYYGVMGSGTVDLTQQLSIVTGGGISSYEGKHFGEIIWARFAGISNIRDHYYDDNSKKLDGNIFTKLNFQPVPDLLTYLDVQLRTINYRFLGLNEAGTNQYTTRDYLFFNPKAGVSYKINENSLTYFGVGVAGKEPTRSEFVDARPSQQPKSETLYNIETGYRYSAEKIEGSANLYGMFYHDQLVLTGKQNDVGDALRQNVKSSYRIGVELEGSVSFGEFYNWSCNLTLGKTSISDFKEILLDSLYSEVESSYKNTPISFSPEVIAGNKIAWSWSGYSAEFQSKYVSEQFLDNTGNSARKLDSYFIHDFLISVENEGYPAFRKFKIQGGILNLFDSEYEPNGASYSYLNNKGERVDENFLFPQAGRNFLVKVQIMF